MRNPIQPILGLSQVLRSKKEEGRKGQDELLDAIIRNAKITLHGKDWEQITKTEQREVQSR